MYTISGSDGLIKLWTIKTSECVKTMDEHEARVWALAINKAEDRIVTGAGDSSILMWKVRFTFLSSFYKVISLIGILLSLILQHVHSQYI